MQNYKVIGHKAILGVGITLKLTDAQANIRSHLLKQKKKGIYTVLEPVQFKQGEIITIVSGNISKAVLANLEDNKPKDNENKNTLKDNKEKADNKPGDIKLNVNNDINNLPQTMKNP